MKKLLVFITLISCAVIAFLYLNEQPVRPTHKIAIQQKTQQPEKIRSISPKPIVKSVKRPDKNPTLISKKPKLKSDPTKNTSLKSYPIEDAELHFVPPEQRYPGNIGGPPPLNIPISE